MWLAGLAVAVGCGDPVPAKSGDWTDNLKPKNVGKGDPEPEPEPEPEPATSSSAEPDPEPKPKPKGGRPLIQYGPSAKIESTFGATPGAKLALKNGSVFVIPEFALDAGNEEGGWNVVFKAAGSGAPKKGPVLGDILFFRISLGTNMKARKVHSKGDPFELRVPTGAKDSVNLAVGEVDTDENGKESGAPKWTILAPTRVDKSVSVDAAGAEKEERTAVFALTDIGPVTYLYPTSADPT
jgi:hypothetical protein